jgi:hypothetical protein
MTIECRRYIESARNIADPIARIQGLAGCIRVIREMADSEAEELVNSLIREAIVEHNANLIKDAVFDEVEISKM